jgi:hypothetical protein
MLLGFLMKRSQSVESPPATGTRQGQLRHAWYCLATVQQKRLLRPFTNRW